MWCDVMWCECCDDEMWWWVVMCWIVLCYCHPHRHTHTPFHRVRSSTHWSNNCCHHTSHHYWQSLSIKWLNWNILNSTIHRSLCVRWNVCEMQYVWDVICVWPLSFSLSLPSSLFPFPTSLFPFPFSLSHFLSPFSSLLHSNLIRIIRTGRSMVRIQRTVLTFFTTLIHTRHSACVGQRGGPFLCVFWWICGG